ncbi:hypothetical protein SSX86_000618 [Deinandra increscens subsp. villosa]|uniref:Rhodanese domain-containing protein n=1 Tax=Deinandra increscens subsp. villosa TaxID=3103831 RepID=A0AAP0DQ47_9ASTR
MLPVCSVAAAAIAANRCLYPNSPQQQVCLYGGRCRRRRHKAAAFAVKVHHLHRTAAAAATYYYYFNSVQKDHLKFIASASLKPPVGSEEQGGDVFAALACKIDTAITNTLSSLQLASKGLTDSAADASFSNLKLDFQSTKLSGLSNTSKEVSSKAAVIAVDGLRHAIITAEEVVVYAYASLKDVLPPDLQNVLTSSEDRVLRPAFQQAYTVLQGFETSQGIDPNDPIVPFLLLLGTSATLWVSYWILTYAGYAGDLSPKITLDLLNQKESVALIDVRPEDFRERDGIPDLRRTARFRYASVTFPEVDTNVKKLLKTGKDLDDTLVAAVIRNLKVVQEESKVIVMDADGLSSKGIARALRKVGIKSPYLVQGGFRSWVQEGLRVKEPKPETTFTILNEEAEAILEDITPLQVIGYGVGFLAAAYALLGLYLFQFMLLRILPLCQFLFHISMFFFLPEWETTLQLIAVFGLGQSIYRRVASYEDSKDFNRDAMQLLVPVKLGGQAISWAAGKLETNRNGLPTLPSSVNVQSRVLQAAAKHESQPPDSEEEQTTTSGGQNTDLSEAA